MSREKFALCTEAEVASWYQPPLETIALAHREPNDVANGRDMRFAYSRAVWED